MPGKLVVQMSWRGLATSTATSLGILAAMEKLPSRSVLVVLAYHRVMPPSEALYDPNVISATPGSFEEQLLMLKRRHALIGPQELLRHIDRPSDFRGIKVALTFDDGYIDNYEHVFPILKRHEIGAAFFVATNFVGTSRLAWWDRAAFMIRHSNRELLDLAYPHHSKMTVDRRLPIAHTIRTVLRHFKAGPGNVDRFLEDLSRATGVSPPEEASKRQFFSWEEAREMENAGMVIGSHSHHHPILSSLTPEAQLEECRTAAELMKAQGCRHSDVFAYPVGVRDSFNAATVDAIRACGYRYAFSNYGGANLSDRIDRFNVLRFGMADDPGATPELRARIAFAGVTAREPW